MNQRTRDDLDDKVRRAWPVTPDEIASHVRGAAHLRDQIDARVAADAAPHTDPVTWSGNRRVAAVLAAVVMVLGAVGAGRLIILRQQDRSVDQVGLMGDPAAEVRSALAATRRRLPELSMTWQRQVWGVPERNWNDVDQFVRQADPTLETTVIRASNGDMSSLTTGLAFEHAEVRQVGGRTYARMSETQGWAHLVDEEGREQGVPGPSGDTDQWNASAMIGLLERHDGGWRATRDGTTGLTRYDAADADGILLAEGLEAPMIAAEQGARPWNVPLVVTLQLWVDDNTGVVRRAFVQLHPAEMNSSNAWATQHEIRFQHGGPSPVEAPEQATDITLDAWCAQNDLTCQERG